MIPKSPISSWAFGPRPHETQTVLPPLVTSPNCHYLGKNTARNGLSCCPLGCILLIADRHKGFPNCTIFCPRYNRGDRAFIITDAKRWNSAPMQLRNEDSETLFQGRRSRGSQGLQPPSFFPKITLKQILFRTLVEKFSGETSKRLALYH